MIQITLFVLYLVVAAAVSIGIQLLIIVALLHLFGVV